MPGWAVSIDIPTVADAIVGQAATVTTAVRAGTAALKNPNRVIISYFRHTSAGIFLAGKICEASPIPEVHPQVSDLSQPLTVS